MLLVSNVSLVMIIQQQNLPVFKILHTYIRTFVYVRVCEHIFLNYDNHLKIDLVKHISINNNSVKNTRLIGHTLPFFVTSYLFCLEKLLG